MEGVGYRVGVGISGPSGKRGSLKGTLPWNRAMLWAYTVRRATGPRGAKDGLEYAGRVQRPEPALRRAAEGSWASPAMHGLLFDRQRRKPVIKTYDCQRDSNYPARLTREGET